MMSYKQFNSEKFRRNLLYLSIGLYVGAAILPSSLDKADSCPFMGLIFLIFGGLFFLLGDTSFWLIGTFWLASPFLFTAWYYYTRKPKRCMIYASASTLCWVIIIPFFIDIGIFKNIAINYGIATIYIIGLLSVTAMLFATVKNYLVQHKPNP